MTEYRARKFARETSIVLYVLGLALLMAFGVRPDTVGQVPFTLACVALALGSREIALRP